MPHIGRFAPSPTGPLHMGSLVTAVASFLSARQVDGRWLVRIEDIDPPREVPGASASILRTLERLDLCWDGDVLYQSTRTEIYRQLTDELLRTGRAYRCSCSRSSLRERLGPDADRLRYPGFCRSGPVPGSPTAVRVRAPRRIIEFRDALQGKYRLSINATSGDYVIFRRDNLPAYHLAVVADDAYQRISFVLRGADLLSATPLHIHLQHELDLPTPAYCHLPVLVNARGEKLSKQTGAAGIDDAAPSDVARTALRYLGLPVPSELVGARPHDLWSWALGPWNVDRLRGQRQICEILDDVDEQESFD